MSASARLFGFVQAEYPWPLGPPDGRYLLRPTGDPDADATHVIVFATLGAPERRRLAQLRRTREVSPEPEPTPVATGRATVIDVGTPLGDQAAAQAWLANAADDYLDGGLRVLNRALQEFRLVTRDPHVRSVSRKQALVLRIGFGAGEQVADGLWSDARELLAPGGRRDRALDAQARLAAVLAARQHSLVCEELVLRARHDLDEGRHRAAALQLLVALDAALAELGSERGAQLADDRLSELRARREPTATAAQAALAGELDAADLQAITKTLERIESALRARAALGES